MAASRTSHTTAASYHLNTLTGPVAQHMNSFTGLCSPCNSGYPGIYHSQRYDVLAKTLFEHNQITQLLGSSTSVLLLSFLYNNI